MVSEKKQKIVQQLIAEVKENPIVGVVNLENLPAQQLQTMRAMLGSKGVKIRMVRKRLLARALTESGKPNIKQLQEKLKGMPALLFAHDNPFSLYATIQKNKSEAPAKAGQKAPKDIVVKAGPTNFAPGPIISELASVGIKTKVDAGKLAILTDTTVAKEGDEITPKLAETLKRLDIKPMEIGLDLVAVWEEGIVFEAKQLRIDEAEYLQNFTTAAQWALNLAVEVAYPAEETTELLITKAFRDARALALEQDIITDVTAEEIIAKVERQANALKDAAGIDIPEKKPEAPAVKPAEEPAKAENLAPEDKKESADVSSKAHPKQGDVTMEEAEGLLDDLQKKGTLR